MKSWRWIMLFLGAGIIAATACTTKTEDDDDDDGTTVTGTTTTGTGTGGTSTGTASTTGTGTGTGSTSNPCAGQVNFGAGETVACQDCIATNCCNEYQACAQGSCDGVIQCALPSGACGTDCFYEICDSGVGYAILNDCATCEGTNCCQETKDCINETACSDCVTGNDASCANSTLDELLDNCSSTSCSEQCFSGVGGGGTGGGGA